SRDPGYSDKEALAILNASRVYQPTPDPFGHIREHATTIAASTTLADCEGRTACIRNAGKVGLAAWSVGQCWLAGFWAGWVAVAGRRFCFPPLACLRRRD